MSVKKISSALARLKASGEAAVKLLNDLSGNQFENSAIEANPVQHLPEIVRQLQLAQAQCEEKERFDGLSEEEIADRLKEEREVEQAQLQVEAARRLEEIQKKLNPQPETEPSGEGEEEQPQE